MEAETLQVTSISESEANARLYTKEYLKLQEIYALESVNKIVYTNGVNTILSDMGNQVPIKIV